MRSPKGKGRSRGYTRRGFLRTMGRAAGAMALVSGGAMVAAAGDAAPARAGSGPGRKNVLLLAVDDLNSWLLGDPNRYTGKVIAPNLRRLADSGVLFTQAFAPAPKCSPSRTAFLSGVAPWKSGVTENGLVIDGSPALEGKPSLPGLLAAHGYYTASFGKISHGYDGHTAWDAHTPHKRDPRPPGAMLNGLSKNVTENDWGPTHLDESQMNDTKYADLAIEQLGRTHDRPFFLACGVFHPHLPWYVPQTYLDMYPLDEIKAPVVNPDDPDDIPEPGRKLIKGTYQKVVDAGQYTRALQGYLASTTYADAQMGRVLDALEASPYRDNTIVVLLSDHGFHLGEKTHWTKGTLWEEATHCLLMVRAPGVTRPRQTCARTVSLLDIYPTLVDLIGLPRPDHLDGHSLVPQLKNPEASRAAPAISAYQTHISVRTERYRYIRYADGTDELYDRSADPREWKNLASDPAYADARRELANALPTPQAVAPMRPRKTRGNKKDGRKAT